MLGSGINPESFKLDYSGMANAAATQAQGVANLGASIGGAIAEVGDYFKKQAEDEKKVQKSLSVAKAIGDLIPGLQPTIQGSLNILNDKELPLSQRTAEADAIADILNLGINEVRNRQDVGFKERELGIREAAAEAEAIARNAPQPITYDFKPVEVPTVVNGVTGVMRVLEDANTGRIRTSDGVEYLNFEDAKAKRNPIGRESGSSVAVTSNTINAGLNAGIPTSATDAERKSIAINNALELPTSTQPDNSEAAPILLGGDFPDGVATSGTPMVNGTATTNIIPIVDGPPVTNVQQIPANKEAATNFPVGFIADEIKPEQKPVTITMEKLSELMALGVRPSGALNPDGTFSVTDFNTGSLPQGTVIESDGAGGFKMTQGAGVGAKSEEVAKAQEQVKKESFRLNQANTEEAFARLDTAGTNNPVFAAGNALLAEALPASETGELAGFYERINDENSFIKMNQQRASSPTGGSAGSMTEKEWPKYQGRFSPLKTNARKDTIAKSLSLNLLNSFEAVNGTPDDVIKLLDDKKIDQATYDNYVNDYIRNRQIARVNANGVEGKSYDWTRLNKKLLSKSTIFEAPASSSPFTLSPEAEDVSRRHPTGK